MNKWFFIMAALSALRLSASPSLVAVPASGNITLWWSYDTTLLDTNLWFNIYETTNVTTPLTNWNCLTNVPGTNLSVQLNVVPGQHFFVATASNFWGETSITSNLAATPPLPQAINTSLRISKSP